MKRRIKRSSVNDLQSFEQALGLLRVDRCPSVLAGYWVVVIPKDSPPVVLTSCRHSSLAVAVLRLHQVLELVPPYVSQA